VNQASQLHSAVETKEMLFWASINLTIGQSCNYLFKALYITRILPMEEKQERAKLDSTSHPLFKMYFTSTAHGTLLLFLFIQM